MKTQLAGFGLSFIVLSVSLLRGDERKVDISKLPAPAAGKMDFVRDIQPIFKRACLRCHHSSRRGQAGAFKVGLRLDVDREAAMEIQGVLVPGQSEKSSLIHAVAGLDVTMLMPPSFEKDRLSPEEISKLRAWIDQGAVWPQPHKLPDGFRLLVPLVDEVFPTDGGEKAWAAFLQRQQRRMGIKPDLLRADNKAKMLVGRNYLDEPVLVLQPFIPHNITRVRVFIPDLVNARVEVYTRGGKAVPTSLITDKDHWKQVWAHGTDGSGLLSPEIAVANNVYGDLEVRIISNKKGPAGVSNILVLTPIAAARK